MSSDRRSTSNGSKAPSMMRGIFGVIMIIIYIGMGVLLFCGVFNVLFGPGWEWLRWAGGALFILYGLWRGYRQFAGIDPDPTNPNR